MDGLRVIKRASPLVLNIYGEQMYVCGCNYIKSRFVVNLSIKNSCLYYSCLTGELLEILNMELALPYLISHWFLVGDEINEIDNVSKLQHLMRVIGSNTPIGYTNFDILTTTKCNANCFYCYEKGYEKVSMTEETAKEIVKFIVDNHRNNAVTIRWFGGEPLVNNNVIDVISLGLKKNNIQLTSTIVSNGWLFSEEIIEKAVKIWNLRQATITIDGTEDVYNKIKSYPNAKFNAYKLVMKNIELLLQSGIYVTIRVNIERHNILIIKDLLDELCKSYNDKNVKFFISPLNNTMLNSSIESTDGDRKNILEEIFQTQESLFKLGYEVVTPGLKRLEPYYCKAEDVNYILIKPNGHIAYCPDNFERKSYGNVNDKYHTICKSRFQKIKNIKGAICDDCPLFAACNPNDHCPASRYLPCDTKRKEFSLKNLELAIKMEYKKYIT